MYRQLERSIEPEHILKAYKMLHFSEAGLAKMVPSRDHQKALFSRGRRVCHGDRGSFNNKICKPLVQYQHNEVMFRH